MAKIETQSHLESSVAKALQRRTTLLRSSETNLWRVIHDAGDRMDGLTVDYLNEILFVTILREQPTDDLVDILSRELKVRSVYVKRAYTNPHARQAQDLLPQQVSGESGHDVWEGLESGLKYQLRLTETGAYGLFLDQRGTRLKMKSVGSRKTVLNLFSYTCGYSVAAASGGAHTTNVDLSKRVLEWGKENFARNSLNPDEHEFLYGDAMEWMKRFLKREQKWDLVIIDPPTFSTSKNGRFRLEDELAELARMGASLCVPGGKMYISHNQQSLPVELFKKKISEGLFQANKKALSFELMKPPVDFPESKTGIRVSTQLWVHLDE